jgi:hypothetical protein
MEMRTYKLIDVICSTASISIAAMSIKENVHLAEIIGVEKGVVEIALVWV